MGIAAMLLLILNLFLPIELVKPVLLYSHQNIMVHLLELNLR